MPEFARKILVPASLAIWVASLPLVAIETGATSVRGISLLIGGAFGPIVGEFAWYANPAYFLALRWMSTNKPSQSQLAAILAMALASVPLFSDRIYLNEGFQAPITGFGVGYVLWLGAVVIGSAGVLVASTPMKGASRGTA